MINKKMIVVFLSLLLSMTFVACFALSSDEGIVGEEEGAVYYKVTATESGNDVTLTKIEKAQESDTNKYRLGDGNVLDISDISVNGKKITKVGKSSSIISGDLKSVIKGVNIPSTVTEIGKNAFKDCNGLTIVNMESASNLVTIGMHAFRDCPLGTDDSPGSITIPSNVKSIKSNAFSGCNKLESVTFETNSLTEINNNTFYGCSELAAIIIPASVESIGDSVFEGCTGLTSVTFEEKSSLETIGAAAFKNCSKITELNIPAGVKSIGDSVFEGCTGLTSVTFEEKSSLETIGAAAFKNCSKITELNIPAKVTSFNKELFSGCTNLQSIGFTQEDWARVTGYGEDWRKNTKLEPKFPEEIHLDMLGKGAIPEGTTFKTITIISDSAKNEKFVVNSFKGLKTEKLIIKKLTRGYGENINLFGDLDVKHVVIERGESNTSVYIPQNYFSGNTKITTVTTEKVGVYNAAIHVQSNAFNGCSEMTHMDFSAVVWIYDLAFSGCTKLTSSDYVDVSSVTNISPTAFNNTNYGLNVSKTNADRLVTTTELGGRLYVDGKKYEITKIDLGTGSYLHLLTDLQYGGNKITELEGSITSLVIKDEWNITSIFDGKMEANDKLTSAFGKTKLKTIDLGKNIKHIGGYAFYGSSDIESVTWSSDVDDLTIGYMAFYNCSSLRTIGNEQNSITNVKSAERQAFGNCTSLEKIYFSEDFSISSYLFSGCSNLKFNDDQAIVISGGIDQYSFDGTLVKKVIIRNVDLTRATYAFQNCRSLEEVVIESDESLIPMGMFKNCVNLHKITCGAKDGDDNNVIYATSIGVEAFNNTGLTNIEIYGSNEKIINIDLRAFDSCSKLAEVTFSTYVTIGDYAFANCENLLNVSFGKDLSYADYAKLSDDVKGTVGSKIKNSSFSNCVSLVSSDGKTGLELTGVVSIGKKAFDGCISLMSVSMSNCIVSIDVDSFINCTSMRTSNDTSNGIVIKTGGIMRVDGDVITMNDGKNVVMINPNVESVLIGKDVTDIAGIKESTYAEEVDTAISVLSGLRRITVEDGNETFKSVSGMLVTVDGVLVAVPCDMPSSGYLEISGIDKIGQYAFRDVHVRDLVINEVKEVGWLAFYGCSSLETLTINSSSSLMFDMGSVYGVSTESILIKGNGVQIKDTASYTRSLTIISEGDVIFQNGYSLDLPESPDGTVNATLEALTISANGKIVWFGKSLASSTKLKTLTLASSDIELRNDYIVNCTWGDLRANIAIDKLTYGEKLITGTNVKTYVSDAMSTSWNGHYEGLIHYDANYGVLSAVSGTKVYVLSNIAVIGSVGTNGEFTVTSDEGYSAGDLLVQIVGDDGEKTTLEFKNGAYAISDYSAEKLFLVEISEIDDGNDASKWHKITFVSKVNKDDPEIDIAPIYVYDNHSILKSVIPSPECPGFEFIGWYTDDKLTTEYKKNDAGLITSDTMLYAKWESLGNYLDVDSSAGTFYVLNNDGTIKERYGGGTFSATTKLKFVPSKGYTLIGMSLTKNLDESVVKEDLTVEISSLTGYACITPIVKYFSSSTDLEYVVERDTPKPTDNIVLAWRFSGVVNQSGMTWSGMPSVPLIVDDRVYIQVNDRIVCLDAKTGATIKEINTGASTTQFYHYLGYGRGTGDNEEYIVDYTSKKVYTYDLEEVCKLPDGIQYVVWHDGYFYSIIKDDKETKGKVWKMSPTELDSSSVMKNLWDGTTKDVNEFQYLFGTTSHAIVENEVMYYISVYSNSISVNALNLKTGEYGTKELTRLHNYYLDDGWLTYYNDYLYITAYTKGLFGSYATTGNSIIGYMKVEGTTIEEPNYVEIEGHSGRTDQEKSRDSLTSAFVIQNGRGYINITLSSQSQVGYFQVFNIGNDGKPEFEKEVASVASHGSIVASTYNLTKGDDGKLNGEVYIYVLNYSAGQKITVFTDVCKDGVWTLSDKGVNHSIESGFGSQAVRVGTEGQLIFYNDSGFVYCYGTPEFASKNWFFVDNGDTAEITTGDGADEDSIKAFEKAVANMFGVRKATFDKTDGTVKALGSTYYVYYYGRDGVAQSVKFTDTFGLYAFSKIKTFYLNKDVSDANDLNPDDIWYEIDGSKAKKYVIKDTMANLRSCQPVTLLEAVVTYSIDGNEYVKGGGIGTLVTIEIGEGTDGKYIVPEKAGYTFLGFSDGQTVYKIGDSYKLTNSATELEPKWIKNSVGITKLEISIGGTIVEDRESLKLYTGDVTQLNVLIEPEEAGVYEVSSSNTNVLSFDGGKLTAIKPGKVDLTITVTSAETTKTVTIGIEIVDRTSSKVTISGNSSISLYKGASTTLSASTDLKGVGVIWTSSDPRIAMVDSNGKVTAISEGVALITATAADDSDVKAVCTVTVSLKKVTSISLSQTSKTMKVGDSSTLSATIAPSDAEDKRVTWSSSNPSVVSVTASGAIQALSKGTAIVTATTVDGSFSASCTVKVEGTVSSISLDKTMLRLEVGSNSTLKATTYPDEALSSNISWTSSDASIVSVSGGYVYAYKVGTATITVSYGDLTATCTVIVSEKSVVKEDTKENTDGSKTVTKEEKTVSGDSTITTNTEETKDKDDKSMGSDVKISAESENKAVKTEATVKKDADGKVIESNVKTTVEAKIQTKDGKEIVTVSKEDILSAVDQIGAVKNTAGGNVEPVIVIDIGKASTASSSSIDLSYESLVQIADGNDTTLRVNTSAGTLEMSSDVISTLSSDGSDLKLGIEKVSDEGVTKVVKEKVKDSTVFSLTATLGKTNVHQLGGKVSVSLPYALKGTVSSDVRIYHVDDDGTLKEMSCKYDANSGMVSFVTDHFSYFVVSEESLVSDAADSDNGISEMNTLLKIVIGLLAVLIAMAAIAMFVHFRGN